MTDLPEGFEGYICDKYKMNPVTFKLLYENKYNSDLEAYTAGIAQGRRERAENAEYKYTPQAYDEMWERVKEVVNENNELKAQLEKCINNQETDSN